MEAKVTIQKTQDVLPIPSVLGKQPKIGPGSQEYFLLLNLTQLPPRQVMTQSSGWEDHQLHA